MKAFITSFVITCSFILGGAFLDYARGENLFFVYGHALIMFPIMFACVYFLFHAFKEIRKEYEL